MNKKKENHAPNSDALDAHSADFISSFMNSLREDGHFSANSSHVDLFSAKDSPRDNQLQRIHFLIENGKIHAPTMKLGPVKLLTEINFPKDVCRIVRVMDNSLVAYHVMPGDYLVVRQDCENLTSGDILLITNAENQLFLADCQSVRNPTEQAPELKIIPRVPNFPCPIKRDQIHSIFVMVLRNNLVINTPTGKLKVI